MYDPARDTFKASKTTQEEHDQPSIVETQQHSEPLPKKNLKRSRDESSSIQSVAKKARQSPSPPPRSPPRQRRRPGAASKIAQADKEIARQRQVERERDELQEVQTAAAIRGVHDVVRQHYNAVPQRGRDWRKTDSKIRGLRTYNNWVKSVLIQKFSPKEGYDPKQDAESVAGLRVLDIGCGKGGDLGKWQKAPQSVELYVGIDPAEVSIDQARERYAEMCGRSRGRLFHGEFFVKDGYGEWLGDIPLIRDVGIDGSVGPGGHGSKRWGGGGFDVVTMMFCMHYAFESEAKARGMLRNVAGSLKKGGRFIGVIPNSDILRSKVEAFHQARAKAHQNGVSDVPDTETAKGAEGHPSGNLKPEANDRVKEHKEPDSDVLEWGNTIYRVRFPGKTPEDGVFRPPFGWKYSYFMEEAVEEVPEYVVPWEAFRALAEDYNLEMQYRMPFADIFKHEKDDPVLGPLSVRMGVRQHGEGPLLLTEDELEAVSFYHAFCFYKV